MVCRQCRTDIPADSLFCPLCGARLPDVDGTDTQREGLPASLAEAATQAAEDAAAVAPAPPRTLVMAPGGGALDQGPVGFFGTPPPAAMPPAIAPAAPFRPPALPVAGPPAGRLPTAYTTPIRIPITPSPARIAVGVVLLMTALWAAAWLLPRFDADIRSAGYAGAGAVALAGAVFILFGLLYRAHAEVLCRVCRRPVIAWKSAFGLHCPIGPHHARINWLVIILTCAFWVGLLAAGIAALALFGG